MPPPSSPPARHVDAWTTPCGDSPDPELACDLPAGHDGPHRMVRADCPEAGCLLSAEHAGGCRLEAAEVALGEASVGRLLEEVAVAVREAEARVEAAQRAMAARGREREWRAARAEADAQARLALWQWFPVMDHRGKPS